MDIYSLNKCILLLSCVHKRANEKKLDFTVSVENFPPSAQEENVSLCSVHLKQIKNPDDSQSFRL